jgi:hypothetical protein
MTAVFPLVFPGSRTLAGWWKHLAPLQPRALWVGHLFLHRVEALVALQLLSALDPLWIFVLRALALTDGGSLQELDQRLHLGLPLLRRLVGRLDGEKLIRIREDGTWSLTDLGRQALDQGSYPRVSHERRAFYFLENEQQVRPPHFLNFRTRSPMLAWSGVEDLRFEPGHLEACVGRPVEWKRRYGFPTEVQQIMSGGAPDEASVLTPQKWQCIVLDRPERLMAALVVEASGGISERFVGFPIQLEGWVLQVSEPAFVIEVDWQEAFPEVAANLSLDTWRQAWRAWCQPRGVPAAEVEACVLEQHGCRLHVRAPPRLVERLRAARSDVFKGDAWLLAGTGRLRAAAQVELVEMGSERPGRPISGKGGHPRGSS